MSETLKENGTQERGGHGFRVKRLVSLLFHFIWRERLNGRNGWPYTGNAVHGDARIVRVKGWRTALIDTPCGQRMTVFFEIKLFGRY